MLIFDFGIVPTVWYFGIVPTVWYFGIVPTVWYFGIVPTVWYCFAFHSISKLLNLFNTVGHYAFMTDAIN
jgi:hypothetical protein